jgi:hypothetical protein
MLALLMLPSQRHDPRINKSYNVIKMCKCVVFAYELIFVHDSLYLFYFDIWDVGYLSLFFFSFFLGLAYAQTMPYFFSFSSFA